MTGCAFRPSNGELRAARGLLRSRRRQGGELEWFATHERRSEEIMAYRIGFSLRVTAGLAGAALALGCSSNGERPVGGVQTKASEGSSARNVSASQTDAGTQSCPDPVLGAPGALVAPLGVRTAEV